MPALSTQVQRKSGVLAPVCVAPDAETESRAESAGKKSKSRVDATRAIRALAERQHGVVARRQLLSLGIGVDLIRARVDSGSLVSLHHGVFAVGHCRLSLRGEWLAAVLACGSGAVLSHGSAAQLWDLRGSRGPIEVTRTAGHRRPHGVRLHQTRWLPPEQVVVVAGIPVMSLERVLLDMAGRSDDRQLEHMLVAADRSKRLSWVKLERMLKATTGRKGQGRLERLMAKVNPNAVDAKSPMEIDFLALCREAGLPPPQVNVWVENWLVDFHWPRERVVIETDSYTFHGDRPAFEKDHVSTAALELAGYRVHRATREMLESDPDSFLALVRKSLNAHS